MLLLTSTSDIVRIVTGSAVSTISVHASYVDNNAGTITPGRLNTNITTATTTTVVAAPGSGVQRNVKMLMIENNNATLSTTVTVQHFDGTTSCDLMTVTLLAGENLAMRGDGSWVHRDTNGAEYAPSMPTDYMYQLGISGTLGESIPRMLCSEANLSALTSGTLFMQAVFLRSGTRVTNLSFFSATTALATGTNGFMALYDANRNLLGQTANWTSEAWAANSIKTKPLTSVYTITQTGIYYIGLLVVATTVPTMKGLTAKTASQLAGTAPILHGASSTGLTTALPNPAAAITVGVNALWCAVT
jgi:hypothetical protein